jgi:preprotein translocase subunit YajC
VFLAEDPATTSGGSGLLTFLPFILIIAAFYFLMIRPQSKRRREEQAMQSALSVGDEIRTAGGLYGTVVAMDDESVTIEASPGVELRYVRGAIARVITKVDEPEDEESAEEVDESDEADTDSGKRH